MVELARDLLALLAVVCTHSRLTVVTSFVIESRYASPLCTSPPCMAASWHAWLGMVCSRQFWVPVLEAIFGVTKLSALDDHGFVKVLYAEDSRKD